MKTLFAKTLLALSLGFGIAFASFAYAAEPTLHDIYQTASAGHADKALVQIDQVLLAHPQSAKAHFVKAELLTRLGRNTEARAELSTAEKLQPGLGFAKPAAVQELKAKLAAPTAPVPVVQTLPVQSAPFPWLWLIVGAALLFAIIYFVRTLTRPQQPMALAGSGGTANGGGYAAPSGFGAAPPMAPVGGGGMGSGLMGSLASGAALGAGLVAGEALMHRVLDGGEHHSSLSPLAGQNDFTANEFSDSSQYDMGGNDFGVADNSGWDSGADFGGGVSNDSSDW